MKDRGVMAPRATASGSVTPRLDPERKARLAALAAEVRDAVDWTIAEAHMHNNDDDLARETVTGLMRLFAAELGR